MKKTFKLTHEKIAPARLVEAIKHEVKKYIKRERNKPLPQDADFWDFDCRFGADQENSVVIHVAEIDKAISQAEADNLESFYLEIVAKPGHRQKRVEAIEEELE
ncbi:DUF6172 family protein [Thiomicrorhabdus sp. ZW0627]|uniref:DUF6172 family protein n=1 Tax=Thiomicrorhabdus sp. ZW0627 TaxID=3039774 RepID=UPI0024368C04|nr:DUF6172 family protein [Thiomicrorhabdus sp. ZW0627]MDG6773261.1 DUF6172 family protein [Thiomicrorhabdus sp. ZW0627]